MQKTAWLVVLGFGILISGTPVFAQVDPSQEPDSGEARMAVLASRYAHGQKLWPWSPRKPLSAGSRDSPQGQEPSVAGADAADLVTFDVPGAPTGPYVGAFPTGLNDNGDVTGYYVDTNFFFHGFTRSRDGAFSTFDPPGSVQTVPGSINQRGEVAGIYFDADGICHGFFRSGNDLLKTFEFPAGASCTTSLPPSINPAGVITGNYVNAEDVPLNFVRATDGAMTTFALSDASGSFAAAINPVGTIAGYDFAVTLTPPSALALSRS